MAIISEIYRQIIAEAGIAGVALTLLALALFIVELTCFTRYRSRITSHSNKGARPKEGDEGISVIVIVGNDYPYIETTLPRIMAQDHPRFELVMVELGTEPEFSDEVALLKIRYPNLLTTRMDDDPRFPISRKMAYNIGIKAASYENILLTTDCATPVSEKWLSGMAKGFARGEVVLGYCGMEIRKGVANASMRCGRLMSSVRSLSAAIGGKPYRGTIHNFGFRRELYFRHKGFGYLNMNLGEDDLFLQRIVSTAGTSVVINPHATVRETQWSGIGWWKEQCKFTRATFPYYTARAKRIERAEPAARLWFYLCVAATAIISPLLLGPAALALWLLRAAIVRRQMWRIRLRLGERGLGWAMSLYDLYEPFQRIWFRISSVINPPKGVWR